MAACSGRQGRRHCFAAHFDRKLVFPARFRYNGKGIAEMEGFQSKLYVNDVSDSLGVKTFCQQYVKEKKEN